MLGSPASSGGGGRGTPHSPPHHACWRVGSGPLCHWPGGPFGISTEVAEGRAFCSQLSPRVSWVAITPLQPGGHSGPSALGAAGVRFNSAVSTGAVDVVSPTGHGSGFSPGHRGGAVRASLLHTPSLWAHSSSRTPALLVCGNRALGMTPGNRLSLAQCPGHRPGWC